MRKEFTNVLIGFCEECKQEVLGANVAVFMITRRKDRAFKQKPARA